MDPDALPPALQTPVFQMAMKELIMVKKDEAMRIRYEDRLESERAYETDVRMSRREGEKLGQLKEKISSIRMLDRLLGRSETSSDGLNAFSLDELDRQIAVLERQLQDIRQ